MLPFLIFGIGVFLLLAGAELLVRSASKIAKILGISEFVIGVTVVAFGTSIPEVGTSVYSALIGHTQIAFANVVGSNVANIALVLGAAALFGSFKMKKKDVGDLPMLKISMVLTAAVAIDLKITMLEGAVLLFFYAAYIYGILKHHERRIRLKAHNIEFKTFAILFLSIIFIYFGAKFSIDGAIQIAAIYGIAESVIGFTLVALSTSLPELATSVIAVYKKKLGISIGNIIGSNIFNSLVVLGLASFAATLTITASALAFQVPAMAILTAFLAWRIRDMNISKYEGAALIIIYLFLISRLF